ncbi:Rieske (2Fe-2S) protein [Pseudoduganella umbonata]|uniref:Nitrite reductase/ring-hydroxylating ferredoxin subunit n=1 Tax=Pseudoduganella umbonata TaxID=864828 RepID=A0A4P8HL39_9BURK|nr:Rieske 2Fe-2S domain-containing protein [Pseudoduganella umbonata]MBB3219553.1 nitrite reductase/ring-hydroxylating ferredoxin subunit [Pseudoduganella umbonata]QCP09626.1 Rieske 2Fe-2S domain-containing protein [Pseudoduganella umbonata]
MAAVLLCRLEDIPDGASRGFDPHGEGRDTVLVVRQGGTVHGWRDACPHYGTTPLAWRKDAYLNAGGTSIVCAAHGALFDIATGVCTLGPCLGQGLQRVELLLTPDNDIYIAPQGARRPT